MRRVSRCEEAHYRLHDGPIRARLRIPARAASAADAVIVVEVGCVPHACLLREYRRDECSGTEDVLWETRHVRVRLTAYEVLGSGIGIAPHRAETIPRLIELRAPELCLRISRIRAGRGQTADQYGGVSVIVL